MEVFDVCILLFVGIGHHICPHFDCTCHSIGKCLINFRLAGERCHRMVHLSMVHLSMSSCGPAVPLLKDAPCTPLFVFRRVDTGQDMVSKPPKVLFLCASKEFAQVSSLCKVMPLPFPLPNVEVRICSEAQCARRSPGMGRCLMASCNLDLIITRFI